MGADAEHGVGSNGKTGNLLTCVAHIFCAVVGAGVLGLPYSLGVLGWIAGPVALVFFYGVALLTSSQLADIYSYDGIEFARYHHAVNAILGRGASIACSVFQCVMLFLVCIAYTITSVKAMQTAAVRLGSGFDTTWQLTLVVGAIELAFSQIRNLEEIWWVSLLGTVTSLIYSFISLILGCLYASNRLGSIGGVPIGSKAGKIFGIFSALGTMGFAYSFAVVLLEIQDTLRQPPKAVGTMRKAIRIGVTGAFFFYLSVACTGYAALGNSVPEEVLDGYPDAPSWVVILANLSVIIHLISAFQIFCQPIFESVESHLKARHIRRELAVAGAAAGAAAGAGGHAHHLPAVAEDSLELEDTSRLGVSPALSMVLAGSAVLPALSGAASGAVAPPPLGGDAALEAGLSSPVPSGSLALASSVLRSRALSLTLRGSGGVINTEPIPDLLPRGGWVPPRRVSANPQYAWAVERSGGSAAMSAAGSGWAPPERSAASMGGVPGQGGAKQQQQQGVEASGGSLVAEGRAHSVLARLSNLSGALGSTAMYHVDTGLCDEHVPLNVHGYFLPFWQRFLLRGTYVAIITAIAIAMPFFSSVVGLIGSICFFPLSVYFPMAMWIKVFKPTGGHLTGLRAIVAIMFVVAVVATIGSVRGLIVAWSTFKFGG